MHGDCSFATLTYDEEHYAKLRQGSLDFRDHTLFLKKLRRDFTTNPIRYYGVGEYGERSGRAHFHYILYGFPTCSGARCQDRNRRYQCQACELVRENWGKGHIYLGDVTKDSISYVAGYVTKGWTHENEYTRPLLNGRVPEQPKMSQAIGGAAIDVISSRFLADATFSEIFLGDNGDVPSILTTDGQDRPLGRYLKDRFRKNLGWEPGLPKDKLNEWKEEMRALYAKAFEGSPFTPDDAQKKQFLVSDNSAAVKQIEDKFKFFNLKGAL